jgi:hypothetical protein
MQGRFSAKEERYRNNVLSGELLEQSLQRIINDVVAILQDYCGPNSGYIALFSTALDGRKVTKFTRDGINTLRAIEYVNPIDSYVVSLLQYIGAGLERRAGDGTTSSMILSAKLIQQMRANFTGVPHQLPYYKLQAAYQQYCELIITALAEYTIKPEETDHELIYGIAYHQALTSSHGDAELAKIVATLLSSLPRRAWSHMIYRQEAIETNERYRVELNDATYSCTCNLMDGRMCNTPLGNAVMYDSAVLIVPPYELNSNSVLTQMIMEKLEALTVDDPPTVCMFLRPANDVASALYQLYARKRAEGIKLVIVWLPDGVAARCNDVNAIYAIHGIDSINSEQPPLMLEGIKVHVEHDTIKLYNFGGYDETGIHIGASNPEHAVCRFLEVLNANIRNLEVDKTRINNASNAEKLKAMRNNIEFKCLGNIVIGGQIYESTAAKDVLEDVLSATREAITSGVLLGGFRSLQLASVELSIRLNRQQAGSRSQTEQERMVGVIASMFAGVINKFNQAMMGDLDAVPALSSIQTSVDVVTGAVIPFTRENLMKINHPMITQSFSAYTEFLKRFGDICPKIVCMTRMIVPNAINDLEPVDES